MFEHFEKPGIWGDFGMMDTSFASIQVNDNQSFLTLSSVIREREMRGIVEQPAWYAYDDHSSGRARRMCRRPPCRFCLGWITFILLLTFIYEMSLPSYPSSSRLIGYQEYATVTTPKKQVNVDTSTNQSPDLLQSISPDVSTVDGPTYPLNVYAPLVPNPAPLTEITVLSCFPMLLTNCKPATTPEKDARLGPWVRVDRPLDPDTAESKSHETDDWIGGGIGGWWNTFLGSFEAKYLFYRRSRRSDVPRVVDLRLVETGSDSRPIGGDFVGWHRVKVDLKSSFFHIMEKTAAMHLYYKAVGGTSEDKIGAETFVTGDEGPETSDDGLEAITELDVTVSDAKGIIEKKRADV